MKIVCLYYDYPPFLLAGSEVGAHEISKYLISQGHEVVVFTNNRGLDSYDGVPLKKLDMRDITIACMEADWIFSQFQWCNVAADMARRFGKLAMLFFHTDTSYSSLNGARNVHICYNSQNMRRKINYRHPYFIFNPPVMPERCKGKKRGEHVTLINCGENKGGDWLIKIAAEMPDVDFMGVQGGYSEQIMDLDSENIWYVKRTANVKLIYEQTKILIVPSGAESWGRVIHEAMINGIPVIATPNPGVKECGGDAVVYIDRILIKPWVNEIRKLLTDSVYYQKRSEASLKRAAELDSKKQLEALENYLVTYRP